MEWNTCNSNNENGLLKSNGPYRLQSAGDSLIVGIRHPQVIESSKPITIGEVKIYGTGIVKENQSEKKDSVDTK